MSHGRGVGAGLLLLAGVALAPLGCGDDDPPPPSEQAGQACTSAAQCYPGIAAPLQGGEAVCLSDVPGGYCTHHCSSDADCCAVEGECDTPHPQVCSPFQSTGLYLCFLSCEPEDVAAAGMNDENAFCDRFAYAGFGCRSTGGGSANRKVCTP